MCYNNYHKLYNYSLDLVPMGSIVAGGVTKGAHTYRITHPYFNHLIRCHIYYTCYHILYRICMLDLLCIYSLQAHCVYSQISINCIRCEHLVTIKVNAKLYENEE